MPSLAFERLCGSSPSINGGDMAADSFRRIADLVRRVPLAELTTSDLRSARELLPDWSSERISR